MARQIEAGFLLKLFDTAGKQAVFLPQVAILEIAQPFLRPTEFGDPYKDISFGSGGHFAGVVNNLAHNAIFPLALCRKLCYSRRHSGTECLGCGCGEIGRRTRFRFWRRKSWGFKSLHPHHRISVSMLLLRAWLSASGPCHLDFALKTSFRSKPPTRKPFCASL